MLEGLKEGKAKMQYENNKLMEEFLGLSSRTIQKQFTGHQARHRVVPKARAEKKAKDTLKAFIKAWRVRKVMQNKEVFNMRSLIKDLTKV